MADVSYALLRDGLAVVLEGNGTERTGHSDFNQVALSLQASRMAFLQVLGGQGIYSGGASVIGDLGIGTTYPPVLFCWLDGGTPAVPWWGWFLAAQTITFNCVSSSAGALVAQIQTMSGVSPAAALGGIANWTFVAYDTNTQLQPSNSYLLGTGVIAASAFTSYTPGSTSPGAPLIGSDGVIPGGTSFPLSPRANQLFRRTDWHMTYVYDGGLSQWVTCDLQLGCKAY